MRSRYRVNDSARAHFVTCTVVEWLPVFTTAARCDILIDSLAFCREHKGLRINGWVIMDNHFHAILGAPDLLACSPTSNATPRAGFANNWSARGSIGCSISSRTSG